ncbi:MAG: haloacid dehalogenase [Acidimicrobiia bacterium]
MANDFDAVAEGARRVLEAKHQAREVVIAASRRTIQSSAASIRATHRGEFSDAQSAIDAARRGLDEAHGAVQTYPDVATSGPLMDARKEYVEAVLTLAFVTNAPLVGPEQLGVGPAEYLNGMAEAASELRRQVLDRLRAGDTEPAERLLTTMDEVYSVLVTIDYPDALTLGLRRTTDALRAVLERTRGDLTTTIVATRLQEAIAGHGE